MGLRIGIDCDGVLRDLIPCITDSIKETHPQHVDKILEPNSWNWSDWLPFWSEERTEQYVFEENYLDFFGPECPPIKEAVEDWNKLKDWAIENGHELVLVSAQREHCEEPTDAWLDEHGFDFFERHYTKNKHLVDVDILIDDSPEKLKKFTEESVNGGKAICMNQSWNKDCEDSSFSIDRLSDIIGKVFG
tara:strand:+ start:620 stop:1189 length:570 start_codon:yes stop_codon:yes gene_type:complete